MGNLLEMVSHEQLCEGILCSEIQEACRLLEDYIESETKRRGGLDIRWVVASAYLFGTRQGVHQERARRTRSKKKEAAA